MPKLTDAQKARVAESDRLYILAFPPDRPTYLSLQCRVCNWAVNGKTIGEAVRINRSHEYDAHPALRAWDEFSRANEGLDLNLAALHDHDCSETFCACLCGCLRGPYCGIVDGNLCMDCQIEAGRGSIWHQEIREV